MLDNANRAKWTHQDTVSVRNILTAACHSARSAVRDQIRHHAADANRVMQTFALPSEDEALLDAGEMTNDKWQMTNDQLT